MKEIGLPPSTAGGGACGLGGRFWTSVSADFSKTMASRSVTHARVSPPDVTAACSPWLTDLACVGGHVSSCAGQAQRANAISSGGSPGGRGRRLPASRGGGLEGCDALALRRHGVDRPPRSAQSACAGPRGEARRPRSASGLGHSCRASPRRLRHILRSKATHVNAWLVVAVVTLSRPHAKYPFLAAQGWRPTFAAPAARAGAACVRGWSWARGKAGVGAP